MPEIIQTSSLFIHFSVFNFYLHLQNLHLNIQYPQMYLYKLQTPGSFFCGSFLFGELFLVLINIQFAICRIFFFLLYFSSLLFRSSEVLFIYWMIFMVALLSFILYFCYVFSSSTDAFEGYLTSFQSHLSVFLLSCSVSLSPIPLFNHVLFPVLFWQLLFSVYCVEP